MQLNENCDSCKTKLKPHDNIYLTTENGYQHLCSSCYNEVMAEYLSIDFENVSFDPITLTAKDGTEHTFSFITRLIGDRVVMEGIESIENDELGYQFQVMSDADEDPLNLYKSLYEKIKRGLSIQHIEPDDLTKYRITDPGVVRGYIDCHSDYGELDDPKVIVDGKEIGWHDFGKMVSTYNGFNFKLEMLDKTDEK